MKTGRHDDDDALARWADTALAQLPARRAPATLAARVLAEIRRQADLPWYRRPWLQWPAAQRWTSAILLGAALYGAFGVGLPAAWDAITAADSLRLTQRVPGMLNALSYTWPRVGDALSSSVETLPPWVPTAAVAAVVAAWISTVGLGTACWRIARMSR